MYLNAQKKILLPFIWSVHSSDRQLNKYFIVEIHKINFSDLYDYIPENGNFCEFPKNKKLKHNRTNIVDFVLILIKKIMDDIGFNLRFIWKILFKI